MGRLTLINKRLYSIYHYANPTPCFQFSSSFFSHIWNIYSVNYLRSFPLPKIMNFHELFTARYESYSLETKGKDHTVEIFPWMQLQNAREEREIYLWALNICQQESVQYTAYNRALQNERKFCRLKTWFCIWSDHQCVSVHCFISTSSSLCGILIKPSFKCCISGSVHD